MNKTILNIQAVVSVISLLLMSTIVFAASPNIQCPVPILEYPLAAYQQGGALLTEGLDKAWTLQSDSSQVIASSEFHFTGGKNNGPQLIIHAVFSLKHPRPYPGIFMQKRLVLKLAKNQRPILKQNDHGVGFWIKAPPQLQVVFLFKDARGNMFRIYAHTQTQDQWQYAATSLNARRVYDDKNKKQSSHLAMPVTWVGLEFYTAMSGRTSKKVNIQLSGFERVGWHQNDKQQLQIQLSPATFAHVYQPGRKITATFKSPSGNIHWRLQNFQHKILASGRGNRKVVVSRTLTQPGYYEFIVELWREGHRMDVRKLALAVIRPTTALNDRLGVSGGHFNRKYYENKSIDLVPILGVGLIRAAIPQTSLHWQSGHPHFSQKMKRFFKLARRKKIHCSATLLGPGKIYGGGPPVTKAQIQDFAHYAAFVASHTNGVCNQFEIWNEWTHNQGQNKALLYGQIVAAVVPAIRQVRKQVSIIGLGGETPYKMPLLKSLLAQKSIKRCDAISLHPYRAVPPEVVRYWSEDNSSLPLSAAVLKVYQLAQQYNAPEKIDITEVGVCTAAGGEYNQVANLHQQARWLVRILAVLSAAPGVNHIYWYSLHDEQLPWQDKSMANIGDRPPHWGLFLNKTYGYAPKPAAVAMAVFSRQTRGGKFSVLRHINGEYGLFRVDVHQPDGKLQCAILWSIKGTWMPDGPHTIHVSGKNMRAVNMMGQVIPISNHTVTLNHNPIYIKGDNLKIRLVKTK